MHERTGGKEYHPASLYFNDQLTSAIENRSADDIIAAVSTQPNNNITEAISNQLIARSFLAEQKSALIELDRHLSEIEAVHEAADLVREYAICLSSQFSDTFVAPPTADPFAKLSGDVLFREVLSAPTENLVDIATQIAAIDTSGLVPPDTVLVRMDHIQDSITEDLWGGVHNLRLNGVDEGMMEIMKDTLAQQIEMIDSAILTGFSIANRYQ